jgi:dihydrolipoamide dehydrogenase
MSVQEVRVPDIGDFGDVAIIEIHVAAGDAIAVDDPIITLESDKATMDVPAELAGTVTAISVAVGDTVSQGDVILSVEVAEGAAAPATEAEKPAVTAADTDGAQAAAPSTGSTAAPAPAPPPAVKAGDFQAEVLVLGSGPGGYAAAFRAADLGAKVVLVERYPTLGGVCLNVGCIPSKALLHAAKVIAETKEMAENGISFGPPSIEVDKLRGWKDSVVTRLTGGVSGLAKRRNVEVITGVGRFSSPNTLDVETDDGIRTVGFDNAIIAAGSESAKLPFIPHDDPRVITSTGALELPQIPERMLVVGGGIIGLEMAAVYHQLGTRVTVVELLDQLIPGTDADIIAPLHKMITKQYENVFLGTKVIAVDADDSGLTVHFDGPKAPETDTFDQILVAVGRQPNGAAIGADRAGVIVDSRGFISVDKQLRTNVPHIFAIGDIVGQPMLAHKATH